MNLNEAAEDLNQDVEFTAYHGNTRAIVEASCRHRVFHESKGDTHWLGNGTYFFEDEPVGSGLKHANEWCLFREHSSPAILKTTVNVHPDFLLDLQDQETRDIVNQMQEDSIQLIMDKLGISLDTKKVQYIDGIFFNMWDLLFEEFPKHVIRRSDFYPTSSHRQGKVLLRSRTPNVTALCVRNIDCIHNTQLLECSFE